MSGPTGLEFLQHVLRGEVAAPAMWGTLGFALEDVGDGTAVLGVEPTAEHGNAAGLVHGGLAAALVDSATGTALWTRLPSGSQQATLELSVTYLRPLVPGAGRVRCRGQVVHVGGSIGVARADVTDAVGTLYATGQGTYAIRRETTP